ncbi:hypothetical protein ACWDA9_33040, partial [Streptomyces sp. NPDC001193]
MAEFIYTMRKTRKAHGDKVILDDVSLNFLPGAKIGVPGAAEVQDQHGAVRADHHVARLQVAVHDRHRVHR